MTHVKKRFHSVYLKVIYNRCVNVSVAHIILQIKLLVLYRMLAVILIALVVYLASTLIKKDTGTKHITKLIRETLPYSGLNEVLYKEFLANINMAIEYKSHTEVSEKLLNRALENLRELALYTVSTDTSVIEELDTLANSINAEFSLVLINESINVRNVFKRINILYFIMTKTIVSTRTRSGRLSKVPERLDPLEDLPEDDFSDDDYETRIGNRK